MNLRGQLVGYQIVICYCFVGSIIINKAMTWPCLNISTLCFLRAWAEAERGAMAEVWPYCRLVPTHNSLCSSSSNIYFLKVEIVWVFWCRCEVPGFCLTTSTEMLSMRDSLFMAVSLAFLSLQQHSLSLPVNPSQCPALHMQPLLTVAHQEATASVNEYLTSALFVFFFFVLKYNGNKLMCNHMTGKCKGNTRFDRRRRVVLNARRLLNVTVALLCPLLPEKNTNGFFFHLSSHPCEAAL